MSDPRQLDIIRPDDWHLHVRDGATLAAVIGHSARRFGRAALMPNLKPPVVTCAQALAYRERVLQALPAGETFTPWMTLYLTDTTPVAEIAAAKTSGWVIGCKLYPAGATTNSDSGVTDLKRLVPVLEAMQRQGMPLMVHGEVTDPEVDIFDREAVFIERILQPLVSDFPGLKVVLEHITTTEGIAFVRESGPEVAGTITPHHLLYDRNALLAGGIRPHFYCLPILKRERHRRALLAAATSGEPHFFLGTDSAPHPLHDKESGCGCAGIFNAHAAIELYAEAFAAAGALDQLEGFASRHGANFYGLPLNSQRIRLERVPWQVPERYPLGATALIPLRAGETIAWCVADPASPRAAA